MSNGQYYGGAPGQPPPQQQWGNQGSGPAQVAPQGGAALTPAGLETTRQLAKWMKFFGIINIVLGAFYCLSLAGVIVGWLPILLGYWKLKAAENISRFAEASDGQALESSLNYMRLYYYTTGILMIVGISLTVLMILGYILIAFVFGMAIFGAAAANQ